MIHIADKLLWRVAEAAGLMPVWVDAHGRERGVAPDTLRAVLETLGFPCRSDAQCMESLERLQQAGEATADAGLLIVQVGRPFILRREVSLHYQIQMEDGTRIMGTARDLGSGRVGLPPVNKPGYHRFSMGRIECTVAAVPEQAPAVGQLLRRMPAGQAPSRSDMQAKGWVLGTQVYGLQRTGTVMQQAGSRVPAGWEAGGDYSLLGQLAAAAGRHGAAGLAISPVHAMFTADPDRYSPYAPSSRLFLNAMYADPVAVLGVEITGLLEQGGSGSLVDAAGCLDWPVIHSTRLAQLERLYQAFDTWATPADREDLHSFEQKGGDALGDHARYEALHAHFALTLGAGHGWQDWPAEFQDPASLAVRHFAESHESSVRFHIFLQWLAARSMALAQAEARKHMSIGLIADMAVGTDPRGSHAWSRQRQLMTGVSVGAPPDIFQPAGQNWGLTAFSPWALRRHGHAGFLETVRAVLAHAGGMRVDHVIGLGRLWLVPQGADAAHGVYLSYPQDELMDLLALEAWRHQALVVGENLGTVPQGFNADMERRGFLGLSVLWFEREDAEPKPFRQAGQWLACSMAMAGTHDLPTIRGWWAGRDIAWRLRHGEYSEEQAEAQRSQRELDKAALWSALQEGGHAAGGQDVPVEAPVTEIVGFLAATPAVLLNLSLEDLTGQEEQVNLPGTVPADMTSAHPNWRRTLASALEDIFQESGAQEILSALRTAGRCLPDQGSGT